MKTELIDFCRSVLKSLRVSSDICTFPVLILENLTLGVMQHIYDLTETGDEFFNNISKRLEEACKEHPLFSCADQFKCEYFYLRIPDTDPMKVLIIGPFSYTTFSNNYVMELCRQMGLPESHWDFMQEYYYAVPVISDRQWIEGLVFSLAQELWPDETLSMTHIETPAESFPPYAETIDSPARESLEYTEEKYKSEDFLMDCISTGNLEKITGIFQHLELSSVKQRFPNSLRDQKNNLIILNTICRKAAQKGGVHPVYLDTQSSKYTDQIEYAGNLKELNKLYREIPYKYCLLVRSYSMSDYSPTIQNIILYIRFNLREDLSLRTIADRFSLNKNYLSSSFKKDTGISLTNYVNQERVKRALYLLNTRTIPIQDIAEKCGITDLNYFSRIFKQQVGMSPSSYRKTIQETEE